VSFHYSPDDGQAEPGTGLARSAVDAGLAKGLKELAAFALGNAWPLIADRNLHAAAFGHCLHRHCCSRMRKLDRVGDKIVQHLPDLAFIKRQRGERAFDLKRYLYALLLGQHGVKQNVVLQ
jgi:hypothetical protein